MSKSKKLFYGLLAALALLIGGGVFVYVSYDAQLVELNQDIARLEADDEVADLRIAQYEERKQQIEDLGFVTELIDSALPITKEQGVVAVEIENFIRESGLTFDRVRFSAVGSQSLLTSGLSQTEVPKGLNGVRVLPVEADIASGATYEQVISLLQKVENNRRLMQVTSFKLEPNDDGKFDKFTLFIDVYVRNTATADESDTSNDATTDDGTTNSGGANVES